MRARASHRARAAKPEDSFTLLEDADPIQISLMQTIDDVAHNRVDRKHASLIPYALQTASMNLRHTNF